MLFEITWHWFNMGVPHTAYVIAKSISDAEKTFRNTEYYCEENGYVSKIKHLYGQVYSTIENRDKIWNVNIEGDKK